ncbi:MAG TPA: outer membrane beta-barrel protein [Xanthobacteraceae bacterium]|nr:outer membrane beta-barrel protein [Xanthobacteraceae bacterium]
MKKLLTLAAVLALSAPLTAFAADLPQPPPPMPRAPAFVPPPFTWTGFYVGVNGGYGWGNWSDGLGDSFNSNGGLAGGTIGFNYQWNWFVAGFEGDIDWSGMQWSQSATASGTFFGDPVSGSASVTYKNNILSTFAARFGVAVDHALFYGKAGGAWTQEEFNGSGSLTVAGVGTASISGSNSFDRLGWMVGVGAEYAFTTNLTAKIEYNYIDFGTENDTITFAGTPIGVVPSKLNMSVVKVGVNWLFNGS